MILNKNSKSILLTVLEDTKRQLGHDNSDSIKLVNRFMQQGEAIQVNFRYTLDDYEYVWIETETCEGVKLYVTQEMLSSILKYIFSGEYEEIEDDPEAEALKENNDTNSEMESDTDSSKIYEDDLSILDDQSSLQTIPFITLTITRKLKMRPASRCPKGYVIAFCETPHGKIWFRLKSTPKLLKFMEDHGVNY